MMQYLTETFNSIEARKAQKDYWARTKKPDFAPRDGRCFRCNKDIYTEIDHGKYKTGHSVEKATNELITGCPHCNYSFVS